MAEIELDRLASHGRLAARSWPQLHRLAATALAVPVALYVLAAALLLVRIGSHPAYDYNWEEYTAHGLFLFRDNPSMSIFTLTDGLMTDSGKSPLVVLPAWLGFELGGVGVASMRAPVAMIAALAVPLLWLVGRRLATARVGVLAALLLALSPVFMLYGRTATVVGISLVPALATIYALARVLQRPGSWAWLAALQALLILGTYAYAPIRFLWPLALALLGGEVLLRRGERRWFALALLVTMAVLPLWAAVMDREPGYSPAGAVDLLFNGRGEHVLQMQSDPDDYAQYIRMAEGAQVTGDPTEQALRLIGQNTEDLGNLLLNLDTLPAISDYWNQQGRLYAGLLVPFFVLGLVRALLGARRRVEDRALLVLFAGFTLPMVLTSRVHVGRLIFATPLLFLLVAGGFVWAATWLARRSHDLLAHRFGRSAARAASWVPFALAVMFLAAVAWTTWTDYRTAPSQADKAELIAALRQAAPELRESGGVAVLVIDDSLEIEELRAAALRLHLDDLYRFQQVEDGDAALAPSDTRVPVLYGGVADELADRDAIPNLCDNLYIVQPTAQHLYEAALALAEQERGPCLAAPESRPLAP